jgi:hypothetical protein
MPKNLLFKYLLNGVCLLALAPFSEVWGTESLPIYYSSVISAKSRQDSVQSELKKIDLQPTIFAKFRDFIDQVKKSQPKVVIAPGSFAQYYPEYKAVLCFSYPGGKSFKYQILSLGDWSGKSLDSGRIGVVEEVDKDRLNDWVKGITGAKFKMVRAVTKPEDLFPMLIFKSADLILVSPDNLKGLREKFVTQVKQIKESNAVGGPTVYFKKDYENKELIDDLTKLPGQTVSSLGFSSIEACGESPK